MENSLAVSLLVTLIGMAVVFLAMALIYASMRLLTAVLEDKEKVEVKTEAAIGNAPGRAARRRAAAIAVALARAEQVGAGLVPALSEGATPWGEFYLQRQLRPGGRGRIT